MYSQEFREKYNNKDNIFKADLHVDIHKYLFI